MTGRSRGTGLDPELERLLDVYHRIREEDQVADMSFMCPECGNRSEARMDPSLPPSYIAGRARPSAVLECPSCGRSTVLRVQNDGFNIGYHYPDLGHPAKLIEDLVDLGVRARSEESPVERARLFTDLAALQVAWGDTGLAGESLQEARAAVGDGADDGIRLRLAAIGGILDPGICDGWEPEALEGRFGALLAAASCRSAGSPEECEAFHDRVTEILRSEGRDTLSTATEAIAAVSLYRKARGRESDAVSELMSIARGCADGMEGNGFRTDWCIWFSIAYERALMYASEMGMVEEGCTLAREMRERFASSSTNPHGGLYATVLYAEAVFLMVVEEGQDVVMKDLDNLQRVVAAAIDNGPFTIDRAICDIIVFERLGGHGVPTKVALDLARQLPMPPEVLASLAELYVRALHGKRSTSALTKELAAAGIRIRREDLVEMAKASFDPAMLWDCPVIRRMTDITIW